MGEAYLTVAEMAKLKGCSQRYIQNLVRNGSLPTDSLGNKSSGTGRGNFQYRIPLSALDQRLQLKYKRKQLRLQKAAIEAGYAKGNKPHGQPINHEHITAADRENINFWKSILKEWDTFRNTSPLPKAEADKQYISFKSAALAATHPDVTISLKTLYRKSRALRCEGESALIDRRGKHGNHVKKITAEMMDIFEYYYLDETQKAASLCRFLVGEELRRRYDSEPQLPGIGAFERVAQNIPIPYAMYFRKGEKAYISKCAPYIARMYDDLEPNDIWVADGHTFDIMVQGEDGKAFRPYLSAFMDVRTRKFMGWAVISKLDGDATIYALRRGVELYGAPKAIQVDNGREYLFHDFSGNAGFRKKAKKPEGKFVPPTILESLGIEVRATLPTNARGKAVERAFKTVKETFSKLFGSYTGGNVLEKPDRLNETLKAPGKLMHIDEFMVAVDTYITGYYNKQPHSGEGMWGRSPDEAYAELLIEKRIVPQDKLHLMFMRYSKGAVKVGKNGITLKVYGEKLQYSESNLWRDYFGEDVYVRYDPYKLESVRVYNKDNQFICEAALIQKLSYNATKEELQAATRERKAQEKIIREHKKIKDVQAQDSLDALINSAASKLVELPENFQSKITSIIRPNETPLPKAAGAEDMSQALTLDWDAMAERAMRGR